MAVAATILTSCGGAKTTTAEADNLIIRDNLQSTDFAL